jgi:hypothetical protein
LAEKGAAMAQKARRKPTAVKALFSILRTSVEVSNNVVKTVVNYVNYELSGEHWLAGSEVRVTLGGVGINRFLSLSCSSSHKTQRHAWRDGNGRA